MRGCEHEAPDPVAIPYDVWKEKKNCDKISMGVVRTIDVIDEDGTVVFANDKAEAAEDGARMIGELGKRMKRTGAML